jgi:hypothetical protein
MSAELDQYKKYISERIGGIVPVLEKAAMGDFSGMIEIPKEEDEFTELFVALNLAFDDLREFDRVQKEYARELEGAKSDLEKKVEERTGELSQRVDELERLQSVLVGRELKMIELKKEIIRLKKKCGEIDQPEEANPLASEENKAA